jgi:hypothetical protein
MLSTTRTVSLADADIGRLPEQLVVGDWQDHGAARSGPGPLGRRGVLSMPVLRVMSYNIRSLRDDVGAVGRVIRHAEADVVCVQEAPRFLWWRRKCAHLARDSGLVIVSGGRDAAANMLLVRAAVKVDSARSVLFTRDRGLHQRGVALARLDGPVGESWLPELTWMATRSPDCGMWANCSPRSVRLPIRSCRRSWPAISTTIRVARFGRH